MYPEGGNYFREKGVGRSTDTFAHVCRAEASPHVSSTEGSSTGMLLVNLRKMSVWYRLFWLSMVDRDDGGRSNSF